LFVISSPYARKGELWSLYARHYGPQGDPAVLVAQGSSRTFNPSLPQTLVDRAYERDAASAAAEYGAEFRRDIESFVSREAVLACVGEGMYEREYERGLRYVGFVDPSGGSNDSFTLCIAHRNADSLFVDAIREVRPPFSPEQVVLEFAAVCKRYGVRRVQGDRYAGEWPREAFRKQGISYELAPAPKSDLYRDLLPLINSRRVELLDHPRLIAQLCGLERRTARSGKDSIDHSPGGHDDVCNAVAGAVLAAAAGSRATLRAVLGAVPGVCAGVEVDPVTGRPLQPEPYNPLAPGAHNECIPGKGINSDPVLELEADAFNRKHGIRRPV
jgi:hypothetical protein